MRIDTQCFMSHYCVREQNDCLSSCTPGGMSKIPYGFRVHKRLQAFSSKRYRVQIHMYLSIYCNIQFQHKILQVPVSSFQCAYMLQVQEVFSLQLSFSTEDRLCLQNSGQFREELKASNQNECIPFNYPLFRPRHTVSKLKALRCQHVWSLYSSWGLLTL